MREIESKMVNWIDKKLSGNGAAQNAIAIDDARSLFIYAIEACVGIREEGGNNKGPLVKLLQETIGEAEGEAWCMSFVQTCLAYVEEKLSMESPVEASEHCLTVWNNTPKSMRVKSIPAPGAIAIWRHGNSTSGHTGVVTEWNKSWFEAVEGNTEGGTAPTGDVIREGGGVYVTKRGAKGNGSMKIIGFLKPF